MNLSTPQHTAKSTVDVRSSDVVGGVYYPSGDGKPMAEHEWQASAIRAGANVLDVYYHDDPSVYVATDLLVYPTEGRATERVAPDLMVVLGIPKLPKRSSYKVWIEGKAPDFVLEVASPSTWRADRGWKRDLYAAMGVREYWLFDAKGDFFDPPLEGYQLERGEYVLIQPQETPVGSVLPSQVLGLQLRAESELVRFREPIAGEDLRTLEEEVAACRAAEDRAAAAERKAAELEALVRRLRG